MYASATQGGHKKTSKCIYASTSDSFLTDKKIEIFFKKLKDDILLSQHSPTSA